MQSRKVIAERMFSSEQRQNMTSVKELDVEMQ
jgi:hypothetical protein